MATEDWNLKAIGNVVKNASVRLAERDEKDPYGRMSNGREVWTAYVYEAERILIVLDELFETVGDIPRPRKRIEIDA